MQNCAIINNYIIMNQLYGDIALDDNATIQYCWWGQNEINPYYYSAHDSEKHPEKINATRWLVMTFTSNNDVVYRNEINQLTVSLKHYFDNETKEIYEYDNEFNLPLDVTFYTTSGTLATKKLVNGVATIDFNPQNGVNAVYAKINKQILKIDEFQIRNTTPNANESGEKDSEKTNNQTSNDTQLTKTKIIVKDFEKYYGSSSKLTIKLVDENNAPIANEKLTVSLGGSKYTAKTDKNGIAKLNIKNKPAKYTAKITFNRKNYVESSKSIKVKIVKPTITASKLKIRKGGKLTVTFKNANKKAIKNVKVKFVIKGKTYIKTTNSKGQVKLTINLKAGKKYTVKVGFKNTAYYGTTTLTKQIKVIR